MKRLNQIGITVKKFRKPYAALYEAALALDTAVFTAAEDVLRLRDCLPTEDELKRLEARAEEAGAKSGKGAGDEATAAQRGLGEEEDLSLRLAHVPRMADRLECFATRLNFDGLVDEARGSVRAITDAADSVVADPVLPAVLATVLRVGNTMNAGGFRAGAQGFKLDVLSKLAAVKPTAPAGGEAGSLTLLHFIAEAVRRQLEAKPDPSRDARHEHALEALERVQGISVADVQAEVDGLRRALEAIADEYPRHKKPFGKADAFSVKMREFHELAKRRMSELTQGVAAMQASLKKAGAQLTGEANATEGEAEAALHAINAFFASLRKATNDNERRRKLKERQEKSAAAKAKPGADKKAVNAKQQAADIAAGLKGTHGPGVARQIWNTMQRGDFEQLKKTNAPELFGADGELAGDGAANGGAKGGAAREIALGQIIAQDLGQA
mmetsp:Transcript_6578/g.19516  ORF Transcript_6578/g.19516 Transcript_6578/m.19516 type:complete len:441 (+) Transcript_6578:346-1668(+)